MAKLFISHAVHDRPLVEAMVDLLESGIGVPLDHIFCSSLKEQSIKPGTDFVDSIREHLEGSTCVLALISEAYYASAFCMCELGGVWLASKSFLPILVPPVDYNGLKAVLNGLQVSKIDREDDLAVLRDEIIQRLAIKGHPTPRWERKRKDFLTALPGLLTKTQFKGAVPREKYEKLEAEVVAYKEEYEAREAKLSDLEKLISDLKEAKDAAVVAKIVEKHSSAIETFEGLTKGARKALGPLPRPVREALYYRVRGDDYCPEGGEEWEDVRRPIEYGQLHLNADENGVSANEKDPAVHRAIEALDALSEWLDAPPPEDFFIWYREAAGGEAPDLKIRHFWDRHLS